MFQVTASVEDAKGSVNATYINSVLSTLANDLSSVGERYYEENFGAISSSMAAEEGEEEGEIGELRTRELGQERYKAAMRHLNVVKRFHYPTGHALIPLDASNPTSDDENLYTRSGYFGDVFAGTLREGMAPNHFNAAASAWVAMLAQRQYGARKPNGYPLTFFVGPGFDKSKEPEKRRARGEIEDLSRYDRIAFMSQGNMDQEGTSGLAIHSQGSRIGVRWVAIASLSPSSSVEGRAPVITVWANYATPDMVPASERNRTQRMEDVQVHLDEFRSHIGKNVINTWNNVADMLGAPGVFTPDSLSRVSSVAMDKTRSGNNILNADQLRNGDDSFIRPTGSLQMYSVLWPLTQLSMSRDDAVMFDASRLYTREVAGERQESGDWFDTMDKLAEKHRPEEDPQRTAAIQEEAWFRWTMGLLSSGTIPYIRHTKTVYGREHTAGVEYYPVRALPHLTMEKMAMLNKAVNKQTK